MIYMMFQVLHALEFNLLLIPIRNVHSVNPIEYKFLERKNLFFNKHLRIIN